MVGSESDYQWLERICSRHLEMPFGLNHMLDSCCTMRHKTNGFITKIKFIMFPSILVREQFNKTFKSEQLKQHSTCLFSAFQTSPYCGVFPWRMKIAGWTFLNEEGSQNSQKTLY
ncbi:hypothetical protein SUGI_0048470 [Cryptomeria japonica]|nr:hypothetical protein SUGI_0048470 [Cryptomeria japonica]